MTILNIFGLLTEFLMILAAALQSLVLLVLNQGVSSFPWFQKIVPTTYQLLFFAKILLALLKRFQKFHVLLHLKFDLPRLEFDLIERQYYFQPSLNQAAHLRHLYFGRNSQFFARLL